MLYGRVVEHVNLSVPEFQRILQRLVGRAMTGPSRAAPLPRRHRRALGVRLRRHDRSSITSARPRRRRATSPAGAAPLRARRARPPARAARHPRAPKSPGPEALRAPERRAALVHTFLHHELQAAELMCWAILAFPDTPEAFRARPARRGARRDPPHGPLRGAPRRARLRATARSRCATGSGSASPASASPRALRGRASASGSRAPTSITRRASPSASAPSATRRAPRSRSGSAPRRCRTCASRCTGSRASRARTPPSLARWAGHLPPPLSPLLMRGAPLNRERAPRGRLLRGVRRRARAMVARARAWLLNLDAEDELADPSAHTPVARRRGARSRRSPRRCGALLGPGDVVLARRRPRPPALAGRAWCPTPRALAAIARAGARVARGAAPRGAPPREPPPLLAPSSGRRSPGARYVDHARRARRRARRAVADGPWLLKRPFGFAGRGRLRVAPGAPDAAAERWIAASLAAGEGLQVEPWVERAGDFALHGHLAAAGALTLGEPTAQRCDDARRVDRERARRRRARSRPPSARRSSRAAEEAAAALARRGLLRPVRRRRVPLPRRGRRAPLQRRAARSTRATRWAGRWGWERGGRISTSERVRRAAARARAPARTAARTRPRRGAAWPCRWSRRRPAWRRR